MLLRVSCAAPSALLRRSRAALLGRSADALSLARCSDSSGRRPPPLASCCRELLLPATSPPLAAPSLCSSLSLSRSLTLPSIIAETKARILAPVSPHSPLRTRHVQPRAPTPTPTRQPLLPPSPLFLTTRVPPFSPASRACHLLLSSRLHLAIRISRPLLALRPSLSAAAAAAVSPRLLISSESAHHLYTPLSLSLSLGSRSDVDFLGVDRQCE